MQDFNYVAVNNLRNFLNKHDASQVLLFGWLETLSRGLMFQDMSSTHQAVPTRAAVQAAS